MRLPRLIWGAGYIHLFQQVRRENGQLRRENARLWQELHAWQDKLVERVGMTPIFTQREEVVTAPPPPVGLTQKRLQLAEREQTG
jgi:hypothetical protein